MQAGEARACAQIREMLLLRALVWQVVTSATALSVAVRDSTCLGGTFLPLRECGWVRGWVDACVRVCVDECVRARRCNP